MAIPDPIKTNFHTLGKAFDNGDVVLLECRDRDTGAPAYAICAINLLRQTGREPEIEMVPVGLMSVPAMINVSIHASPQRQGEPASGGFSASGLWFQSTPHLSGKANLGDEANVGLTISVSIHASPQRQGEPGKHGRTESQRKVSIHASPQRQGERGE